jgi:hypothetical protein
LRAIANGMNAARASIYWRAEFEERSRISETFLIFGFTWKTYIYQSDRVIFTALMPHTAA